MQQEGWVAARQPPLQIVWARLYAVATGIYRSSTLTTAQASSQILAPLPPPPLALCTGL